MHPSYEPVTPAPPELPTNVRAPRKQTMLDEVANDLALWIDQISTEVAAAFAPGRAPFAHALTEQQKMEYYTARLFNPDGSPNQAGRMAELERLGPEGFANVYKAVVAAHPELKPPSEPEQQPEVTV